MEVPKELLDKWQALRSPGDLEKICESMPQDIRVSKETIRRVFTEGQCSSDVLKAVGDFYEERISTIAKYLPTQSGA